MWKGAGAEGRGWGEHLAQVRSEEPRWGRDSRRDFGGSSESQLRVKTVTVWAGIGFSLEPPAGWQRLGGGGGHQDCSKARFLRASAWEGP